MATKFAVLHFREATSEPRPALCRLHHLLIRWRSQSGFTPNERRMKTLLYLFGDISCPIIYQCFIVIFFLFSFSKQACIICGTKGQEGKIAISENMYGALTMKAKANPQEKKKTLFHNSVIKPEQHCVK